MENEDFDPTKVCPYQDCQVVFTANPSKWNNRNVQRHLNSHKTREDLMKTDTQIHNMILPKDIYLLGEFKFKMYNTK